MEEDQTPFPEAQAAGADSPPQQQDVPPQQNPPPQTQTQTQHSPQFYKPNVDVSVYVLLNKLFIMLDRRQRGYLTVKDFVRLGFAMTEKKPTIASAEFMLEQANIAGNGKVDRDEFMGYCDRLAQMPIDLATAQLTCFVNRLARADSIQDKEIERQALASITMDDV